MKRFVASQLGLLILVTLLVAIGQTSNASPGATFDSQAASSQILSDGVSAPDACTLSYTYTVSSGSIVTSTNLLAGSQCGGCVVPLALPFPVTFYDQTYTDANISTSGNLQFVTSDNSQQSCPMPYPQLGPSMLPYWSNVFETSWSYPCQMAYGADCGVFTTLSGTEPNRTFKIEWRARAESSNHETVDFEIRLYENSDSFDFVYGFGELFGYLTSIGVQDGSSQYTSYICDVPGSYDYQTVHWTPQIPATCAPTWTPTPVSSPTDTPTPTATPTCGPSWSAWDHPSAGPGDSRFTDIVAISANDVWAVGSFGDSNNYYQTLAEHWDGAAWSVVDSPDVSSIINVLTGVSAVASDDVWAVGWYNTTGPNAQGMTMHWDGTQWSLVSSPTVGTNSRLNAVAAISASDVWAVGYSGASTYQTLAMHWDGAAWSVVGTPNVGTGSSALNAVATISSSDVWAIGYGENQLQTLTLHWNGSSWSVVGSPSVGTDGSVLTDVTAIAPHDVWAVGYSGSYFSAFLTLTMHWDGSAWNVVASPNPSVDNQLNGVAGLTADDAWAVGFDSDGTSGNTLTEHWDGSTWNVVVSANVSSTNNLMAVALVSAYNAWAVGSAFSSGQFYRSLIERYVDSCEPITTPSVAVTNTPTIPPSASATPTTCDISFNDVLLGSTFYPYVHCLACLGIVQGYPDGSFRPNDNVTRGQASKILAESAGYDDAIPPLQQTFNDVSPGSTFWLYIERVVLHGAINGYPCGGVGEPCPGRYFRPQNTLSRGQAAKIVSITAGYQDVIPPNQQTFTDVPPDSTFWAYIERVALHGVVSGYSDDTFRPQNPATRGQLAKVATLAFLPGCGQ